MWFAMNTDGASGLIHQLMLAALLVSAACVPPHSNTGTAPPGGEVCLRSSVSSVARVQESLVFREVAETIAIGRLGRSADASAEILGLCGQLTPHPVDGFADLTLVSLRAVDSPYWVDVAFAVSDTSVALVSPLRHGRPVGGLDTAAWNSFARRSSIGPIARAEQARSLACGLLNAALHAFDDARCQRVLLRTTVAMDGQTLFAFEDSGTRPAATIRVASDGTVR